MSHSTADKSLAGFRRSLIGRIRNADQIINDRRRKVKNYRAEAERHAAYAAIILLDQYTGRSQDG